MEKWVRSQVRKLLRFQTISIICHKVIHILLKDSLKQYYDSLLDKHVDPEYYVDSTYEVELREKFPKPFVDHDLLKFMGLSKEFNPDHVKAFYCNLELRTTGFESRFKDHVVKFGYHDFTKYLGLTYYGLSGTASRLLDYDRVHYVMWISKFVVEKRGISNFSISKVKFNIWILHWIVFKVFYKKPYNWGKADDFDLYLTWALLSTSRFYWVKFSIDQMLFYQGNPNKPLFYSSFVQMILEINGIMSSKDDLVESPKVLDEYGVSMMRYYRDTDGVYYYLEKSGRKIYDDKIVKSLKGPSNEASVFTYGLSSAEVNIYLDDLVGKI